MTNEETPIILADYRPRCPAVIYTIDNKLPC